MASSSASESLSRHYRPSSAAIRPRTAGKHRQRHKRKTCPSEPALPFSATLAAHLAALPVNPTPTSLPPSPCLQAVGDTTQSQSRDLEREAPGRGCGRRSLTACTQQLRPQPLELLFGARRQQLGEHSVRISRHSVRISRACSNCWHPHQQWRGRRQQHSRTQQPVRTQQPARTQQPRGAPPSGFLRGRLGAIHSRGAPPEWARQLVPYGRPHYRRLDDDGQPVGFLDRQLAIRCIASDPRIDACTGGRR